MKIFDLIILSILIGSIGGALAGSNIAILMRPLLHAVAAL
jgi:hypothetical protein